VGKERKLIIVLALGMIVLVDFEVNHFGFKI
jgi:hypothetical protein